MSIKINEGSVYERLTMLWDSVTSSSLETLRDRLVRDSVRRDEQELTQGRARQSQLGGTPGSGFRPPDSPGTFLLCTLISSSYVQEKVQIKLTDTGDAEGRP
jgi:hypothetical protein